MWHTKWKQLSYEIRKAKDILITFFWCSDYINTSLEVSKGKFFPHSWIFSWFGACALLVTAGQCARMLLPPSSLIFIVCWVVHTLAFFKVTPNTYGSCFRPRGVGVKVLSHLGLFGEVWEARWESGEWINEERMNEVGKAGALRSQQQPCWWCPQKRFSALAPSASMAEHPGLCSTLPPVAPGQ